MYNRNLSALSGVIATAILTRLHRTGPLSPAIKKVVLGFPGSNILLLKKTMEGVKQ
jgi:hypothetical protein